MVIIQVSKCLLTKMKCFTCVKHCCLVKCISNIIYKITEVIFKRWNEIKNHAATNKNNSNFKKSFKDFYDAFDTKQQRQVTSKNLSQPRSEDIAEDAELKTTNEDAQEILSMIEWSEVWSFKSGPTNSRHKICLELGIFLWNFLHH